MPSPDLLPEGRSFPSVVAPPLDNVLTRARRRRVQRAGLVGVLTVATVGAAALVFVPHGSSQSLDVVTPAVPGHSASPSAHVRPTGVQPALGAAKVQTGRGSQPAQPLTATRQRTVPGTTARASQPGPVTRPAPMTPIVGPAHRITRYDPTRSCTGNGPNATTGWCSYYDGATSGVAGHAVTLATAVCRLPGQQTGVLVSSNGRQADFDVGVSAYPASWRWSHGRTFSKASTSIRVPAGTCVEWYVSWRVVNNAGAPMPPGRYYLDAIPHMSAATGYAAADTQSPVTFTVR